MPGTRFVAFIILAFCLPIATGQEGIVPILCANGYQQLPGESNIFGAYASALAQIIANDTSLGLKPVVVGSLGEFVEYLAFPQTYVGIISIYSALIPAELQAAMIELFDRGVGLIGINEVAFATNLSRTILPVFANATSEGRLTVVGGKIAMGHTYVKSDPTHPIAAGLPDQIFFSDVRLYWSSLAGETKARDPPKPSVGTMAVVYKTQEAKSSYEDGMVPAVIAYEDAGRSVVLPAFGLTERGGPDDYSGVVYNPEFQALLKSCLRWTAERGRTTSQQRMEALKSSLDAFQRKKAELAKEASEWRKKSSQRRIIRLALFTALGLVAIAVVYRLTFKAEER